MQKTIFSALLALASLTVLQAQKPVLVIPTGHSGGVHAVSCSADGKSFLTAGGDNLIKIWNAKGQELSSFRSDCRQEYRQVYLSPDGSQILAAYCHESMDAWILDADTGEAIFTLEGQEKPLRTAKYSRDSKTIATADEDGVLSLWDANQGQLLRRWKGHDSTVVSLDFSPDGKQLATLSEDGLSKVWATKTGMETLRLATPGEALQHIRFSPDGKTLSIATNTSEDGVSLWSVETKQKIATTSGFDCIFSPDGKFVCVFRLTGAVIFPIEDLNGKPLQELAVPLMPSHWAPIFSMLEGQFLPDGKSIFLNAGYIPVIIDFLTGKVKCAFKGYAEPAQSVSFSPNGERCLIGSANDILEWDFAEGRRIKRMLGHTGDVAQAKYSPDGQKIVSVSDDYRARVWDAKSGDTLFTAPVGIRIIPIQSYARILAISPDGQYFVKGNSPGYDIEFPMLSLWNLKDGSPRGMMLEGEVGTLLDVCDLDFSPDGKWLAVLESGGVHVWDVTANRWLWQFKFDSDTDFRSIAFNRDGSQLAAITSKDVLQYWDVQTGDTIRVIRPAPFSDNSYENDRLLVAFENEAQNWVSDLVFSPDGKWMAKTGLNKAIHIWDVQGQKYVRTFLGHDNAVKSLDFSPDSRWLISASTDNTVRIWDVQKGLELAKIVHLTGDNWVVTTPSGLFDASDDAKKMMYYVVDYEKEKIVLDLEQLQERYWQPGLLGAILGLTPYPVKDVGVFDNLALFPSIEESTRIESAHLYIKLRERNGGLGKLTIRINGIVRNEDLNPLPRRKTVLDIDLDKYSRFIRSTTNTIELEVYESRNKLKSQPYILYYQPSLKKRGEASKKDNQEANICLDPRHLYLIVVGTSMYPQGVDSLPAANDDAIEMARVLSATGRQLYDDRVHLTLLSTEKGITPSKANIAAAFKAYEDSASVCDVLVVFFAGHGKNWGEDGDKSNFYYLTKDITFGKLNDDGIRKAYAISDQELTDWMGKIPAENKLLILDACNSGQAAINMGGIIARDMDPDKIVAFNIMSGNTGSYVISGSSESGLSFESTVFGHGLLTYSLLEGMSATALKGSKVDVLPLLLNAYKRVAELAQSVGEEQTPIIAKPRGNASFFVGKNDGSVKIELPETKPMVIQSFLFEQDTFNDRLGLTKAVNKAFRSSEIKGKLARWFFSEISEHPQGFSVRGTYTQNQDNTVTVKGRLLRGEEWVGKPFEVNGAKDAKALAALILKAVTPGIKVPDR
jgi:WD40 repeat protein